MKGFVGKDACIGCGLCEGICPEVFKKEEDGKASASENEILEINSHNRDTLILSNRGMCDSRIIKNLEFNSIYKF